MNWLDYFLLLVVGLSTVLAAMRGFVAEVISLVSWVAAFTVASRFGNQVEPYLAGAIANPTLLGVAGFVVTFIATLVAMGLLGNLLQRVVGSAGLTALDRSLGMLFGFARGALLVMVGFLILLAVGDAPPKLVQQSLLSPHFMNGAQFLGRTLPEGSAMLDKMRGNWQHYQDKAVNLEKGVRDKVADSVAQEIKRSLAQEAETLRRTDSPNKTPAQSEPRGLDDLFRKYNNP